MRDRWIEHEDIVTCRSCWGTGQDDDELDGNCVNCLGKGEYDVMVLVCCWCGDHEEYCQCDEYIKETEE